MKRVLIIDDDPSVRLLYEEELIEEGYEGISSDGQKGVLKLIAEQRPDLILLDLNLGSRSGLDLLRAIRKESLTVPVILLTARPGFMLDSKSVSAYAYVPKSSDLTSLKREVEKCLNAPGALDERRRIIPETDSQSGVTKPAVGLDISLPH